MYHRKWWHDKIMYQIYPKSFCDTNGDGIGDLRGIISKLDYLKDLGADVLWLSPIYKSPLADEGYDISDDYAIDPRFGTMADMDELIAEAKKRDMFVLMDLVANHCSDEHAWFRKACEDPDGPYGQYFYIRGAGADGGRPTNWRSYFGGPAWDLLPGHTDQYYLHVFHKKQPDLNWENPKVREEIFANVNWWLDKGLGGFRIDAIMNIKKPAELHDYEPNRTDGLSPLTHMLEEAGDIGPFLTELKEETFAKHDAFTVGEVCGPDPVSLQAYIGEDGYFSSIFDFEENTFGRTPNGYYDWQRCTPEDYKQCVFRAQARAGSIGFLSNIIENHDEPRGVNRYLPDGERTETAKKALACAYFLLRGIPFIYQGQEIGMENKVFRSASEIRDVGALGEYETAKRAGCSEEEALRAISAYSRDNTRTPMQWSDAPHAGFTTGTPWIEENENYREINAEKALKDPDSLLYFYRKLAALRKNPAFKDTLVYGRMTPYLPEEKNLLAYVRESVGKDELPDLTCPTPRLLVAVNMQKEAREIPLPGKAARVLLSNLPVSDGAADGRARLKGWQAAVWEFE